MGKDQAASNHGTTNPPESAYRTTAQLMRTIEANLKKALGA